MAPGAAGQLLRGGFGTVQGTGDVGKRHAEHVVQDEREPLGGSQGIEHHEQRSPTDSASSASCSGSASSPKLTTGSGT